MPNPRPRSSARRRLRGELRGFLLDRRYEVAGLGAGMVALVAAHALLASWLGWSMVYPSFLLGLVVAGGPMLVLLVFITDNGREPGRRYTQPDRAGRGVGRVRSLLRNPAFARAGAPVHPVLLVWGTAARQLGPVVGEPARATHEDPRRKERPPAVRAGR